MSEAEKMAKTLEPYSRLAGWEQLGEAAALIRRLAAENAALKAALKQEQEDHSEMLLIAHLDGLTKNREAHAKELAAQADRIKKLEEARAVEQMFPIMAARKAKAIARAELEPRDE